MKRSEWEHERERREARKRDRRSRVTGRRWWKVSHAAAERRALAKVAADLFRSKKVLRDIGGKAA